MSYMPEEGVIGSWQVDNNVCRGPYGVITLQVAWCPNCLRGFKQLRQ